MPSRRRKTCCLHAEVLEYRLDDQIGIGDDCPVDGSAQAAFGRGGPGGAHLASLHT